jgi:DNA polymerase III alpha subunit (gram-positive type)
MVFDFETGSRYPETCEPIQLAACVLDSRTLKVKPDSEFQIYMRPEDDAWEKLEKEALDKNKITVELLKEKGVPQKQAWESFVNYVKKYNRKGSVFTAPIPAGHNIIAFDLPIINRLCRKYGNVDKDGNPNIFHMRDKIDLMYIAFLFFENKDEPGKYNQDMLCDYLGVDRTNSHNAVNDVKNCAMMIQRFMKYFRNVAGRTNFKDCFAKKEENPDT